MASLTAALLAGRVSIGAIGWRSVGSRTHDLTLHRLGASSGTIIKSAYSEYFTARRNAGIVLHFRFDTHVNTGRYLIEGRGFVLFFRVPTRATHRELRLVHQCESLDIVFALASCRSRVLHDGFKRHIRQVESVCGAGVPEVNSTSRSNSCWFFTARILRITVLPRSRSPSRIGCSTCSR